MSLFEKATDGERRSGLFTLSPDRGKRRFLPQQSAALVIQTQFHRLPHSTLRGDLVSGMYRRLRQVNHRMGRFIPA